VQAPEAYEQLWRMLLAREVVQGELVNRAKDGTVLTIEATANPVLDESGAIVAFLAIQRDVTARKVTEEALRRSEGRFRTLMEKIPEGVGALDMETYTIRYANPALCRMLGYSEEELRGARVEDFQHPEDRGRARLRLDEISFEGGDSAALEVPAEYRLLARSGSVVNVEITTRVVELQDGPVLLSIVRDTTDRKRFEEHMHQSQRLEAVGQLAGGIAHDFNNLLTIIQANAELVRHEHFDGDGKGPAEIAEVEGAVQRGKELVQRLFAFSRSETLSFDAVDLRGFLLDLKRPLRRLLPESIEIRARVADGTPEVWAHVGSLEQILINLTTNARDAMPEGGVLEIAATPVRVSDHDEVGRPAGDYVCIAVTDDGVGMPAAVREHIFEPFFTTKAVGKGTGLGMAAVYGLVNKHAGFVSVDSEEGRGTAVRVHLPLAGDRRAAEPGVRPRGAGEGTPSGGTETILVVEDEDAVRRAAMRSLSLAGYTVLAARDGVEALEVFRDKGDTIDLVLTDLVMPRMGGRDFAARLRELRPGLPVVFASGYDADAAVHEGEPGSQGAFLHKPWTLQELTLAVRQGLAARGRNTVARAQGAREDQTRRDDES
jgi:PAS domain S-box-containing protein